MAEFAQFHRSELHLGRSPAREDVHIFSPIGFDSLIDIVRNLGDEQFVRRLCEHARNVALDVARMLAKTADELLVTEIADNVYQGVKANRAKNVHIFARRGPAQVKFTPMELRELGHSANVDVVVHPEGFELDEGSMETIRASKSVKLTVDTLQNYIAKAPEGKQHRIHIHFCQSPVEILGEEGKVVGLRTEVTKLNGDGNVRGTGEFMDWDVQACLLYTS